MLRIIYAATNDKLYLFRLKSDKSIVIKEADKGNAVVILD